MTVWVLLRDVAFIFAAVLYALAVGCWAVYLVRWGQAARRGMAGRRQDPRRRDFDWMGALPFHVWMGAWAIGLWQVPILGMLVVAYTDPPAWWGLPFILAGDVAMLGSLWSAVRYEMRLLH